MCESASQHEYHYIFSCLPTSHRTLYEWLDFLAANGEVVEITAAARARWKTENENHNVLKTKGYHLEHNFGHGKQQLATFLLTLNLLAFLFHTLLQLLDSPYQQIRQRLGSRQRFFNDLRALTCYLVFESWQHLIAFMLEHSASAKPMNSS
jgi:hypothetical protein